MDATRIVEIAVGVLLIIVVITIAFQLKDTGASFAQSFASDLNKTTTSIEESKFTKYATSGLSGADVVSAIKQLSGEVIISVNTYKSVGSKVTNKYSESGMDGALSSYSATPADAVTGLYINPNAKFTGTIVRTNSGIIKGLAFDQAEFVDSAVAVGPSGGNSGSGSGGNTGNGGNTGGGGVTQTPNDQFNALSAQLTDFTTQYGAMLTSISQAIESGGLVSGGGSGGTSGGTSQVSLAMFNALKSTVEGNQGNIDNLTTQLVAINASIDALNNSINAGSNNSGTNTGNSNIADISATVSNLRDEFNELNKKLNDPENGDIVKLKDDLASVKAQLKNLQDLVGQYPDDADAKAVITSLLEQIKKLEELNSELSELQGKYEELQEQVEAIAPGDESTSTTSEPEPGTHY